MSDKILKFIYLYSIQKAQQDEYFTIAILDSYGKLDEYCEAGYRTEKAMNIWYECHKHFQEDLKNFLGVE